MFCFMHILTQLMKSVGPTIFDLKSKEINFVHAYSANYSKTTPDINISKTNVRQNSLIFNFHTFQNMSDFQNDDTCHSCNGAHSSTSLDLLHRCIDMLKAV